MAKPAYRLLRIVQELGPISRPNLWKFLQRTEPDNPFVSVSHLKKTAEWLHNHEKIAVKPYRPLPGEVIEATKSKKSEFVYRDLPENTPAQFLMTTEEKQRAREERKNKIQAILDDLQQRKDDNYEKTLKELTPLLKQLNKLQTRDSLLAAQPALAAASAASSTASRTNKKK
eukprot:TRINITY_DN5311_c0_g1_i1.p1 TRINITY_DN5311_c0_g1~~TRINITY_DN5311_c0_g1_i1.p1  ORF type:complete len:172 (+),score=35.62 TRINITY_DN5311_c0_g1_i1:52-567(+)